MNNPSKIENKPDKLNRIRILFPGIYIILLGVVTLIFCLILVFFIGLGDPADMSEWNPERESRQIFSIISVGVIHFIVSVASSILWFKKIQWSKYLMLILAVIGTLIVSFVSLGLILICSISLLVSDIYLIRLLFFEPRLSNDALLD